MLAWISGSPLNLSTAGQALIGNLAALPRCLWGICWLPCVHYRTYSLRPSPGPWTHSSHILASRGWHVYVCSQTSAKLSAQARSAWHSCHTPSLELFACWDR